MCAGHDGIVNSRHSDLHCRNVSWWLRMVAVCENYTSLNSQSEGCKGSKSNQRHRIGKGLGSSCSPIETCARRVEKTRWGEKRWRMKYSLSFLYNNVNTRLSDCSIFSTDLQNDERGWCKSYSCCSVSERELVRRGRKEWKRGKTNWQTVWETKSRGII